ncbi:MAG TPA: metalloregulator ArsR/SmtB family transcription factor [Nitriliruptorales bacterium]|nr:metalloregulator ArsR/SmtB family transcription factor [Nitriliruptorales bacterium]
MFAVDAWQVVSEPRRRRILRLVWERELSAGQIAAEFDVTFGAVSQHLAVLRQAGFVRSRREGNHVYYRADREGMGPFADALEAMWTATLDEIAEAVEAAQDREEA